MLKSLGFVALFTRDGVAFDGKDWAELKAHQPFYAQVNFSETHRDYHAPAEADPAKAALKKLRTAVEQSIEQTGDRGRLPDPDAKTAKP